MRKKVDLHRGLQYIEDGSNALDELGPNALTWDKSDDLDLAVSRSRKVGSSATSRRGTEEGARIKQFERIFRRKKIIHILILYLS